MQSEHFSDSDANLIYAQFQILFDRVRGQERPDDWVASLGRRIFEESRRDKQYPPRNGHPSEAAFDYIQRETHYALTRAGFNFNGSFFEGVSFQEYDWTRSRVVRALADRAFVFYTLSHSRKPGEHLRCDLRDYLQQSP